MCERDNVVDPRVPCCDSSHEEPASWRQLDSLFDAPESCGSTSLNCDDFVHDGDVFRVAKFSVDKSTVAVSVAGVLDNEFMLSSRLATLGYSGSCNNLAETLISAYVEWGCAFADLLEGEYLINLWDGRTARLLVVIGHRVEP